MPLAETEELPCVSNGPDHLKSPRESAQEGGADQA